MGLQPQLSILKLLIIIESPHPTAATVGVSSRSAVQNPFINNNLLEKSIYVVSYCNNQLSQKSFVTWYHSVGSYPRSSPEINNKGKI